MDDQRKEIQFSPGKTALYSIVLTLAGLGLIEAAARQTQPGLRAIPTLLVRQIDSDIELPFMEPDPELFWKPAPGFSGPMWGSARVTINADGLREHAAVGASLSSRMLCFGDSITFGYGVGDNDTYPAALAGLLGPLGIEVRNAGVTGYTSYQALRWLRRQLKEQKVDEVTLLIGWNDSTRRPLTDEEYAERLMYSTSEADEVLRSLAIYRLMKALWLRRGLGIEAEQLPRITERVPLEQYARNLEQFVTEARAAGARPHFIALPSRLIKGATPASTAYSNILVMVAKRLSVPLYDVGILSSSSREVAETGNAGYFIDSLHLSAEGNRLMAGLLATQLKATIQ